MSITNEKTKPEKKASVKSKLCLATKSD